MNSDQLRRSAVMIGAIFDALHTTSAPLDERIAAVSAVLESLEATKQEHADKKLGVTK